jgi:putative transposase
VRTQKKTLGDAVAPGRWVEPDVRDEVVTWCRRIAGLTGCSLGFVCSKLGLHESRLHEWSKRQGVPNNHNGGQPRSTWVDEQTKAAVVSFYLDHVEDGYRRCAYMMLDAGIAAVCPSTVFNILKRAGALRSRNAKPSRKGTGFKHALGLHEQWHTDISYIRIGDRFYFLISFLDGYSRLIVHSELREAMTDQDVNVVFQQALERCPEAVRSKVRVISDNGKQFTGKEFRSMIQAYGLTHTTTSPYYPQSNGKLERWHQTLKIDINAKHLNSVDHARRIIAAFVRHYNEERLHSAIGYVTPKDMAEGRQAAILAERDRRLNEARAQRGWARRSAEPVEQLATPPAL